MVMSRLYLAIVSNMFPSRVFRSPLDTDAGYSLVFTVGMSIFEEFLCLPRLYSNIALPQTSHLLRRLQQVVEFAHRLHPAVLEDDNVIRTT